MVNNPNVQALLAIVRRPWAWVGLGVALLFAAFARPDVMAPRGELVFLTAAGAVLGSAPVAVMLLVWSSATAAVTLPGFSRPHLRLAAVLAAGAVLVGATPAFAVTGHAVPALALSAALVAGVLRWLLQPEAEQSLPRRIVEGLAALLIAGLLVMSAFGSAPGPVSDFFGGRSPGVVAALLVAAVAFAADAARGAARQARARVAANLLPVLRLDDLGSGSLGEGVRLGGTAEKVEDRGWPDPRWEGPVTTVAGLLVSAVLSVYLLLVWSDATSPTRVRFATGGLLPVLILTGGGFLGGNLFFARRHAEQLPHRLGLPPERRHHLDRLFLRLLRRQAPLGLLPIVPLAFAWTGRVPAPEMEASLGGFAHPMHVLAAWLTALATASLAGTAWSVVQPWGTAFVAGLLFACPFPLLAGALWLFPAFELEEVLSRTALLLPLGLASLFILAAVVARWRAGRIEWGRR